MGLKIYNSLTNKIEEFKPINEGKVNMYVCGPTVYNYIHIGNARPVVFYDMLKNYLEFIGYDVTYASNVTEPSLWVARIFNTCSPKIVVIISIRCCA